MPEHAAPEGKETEMEFTALIVDDEAPMTRVLADSIPWEKARIGVVEVASRASDAVRYIRNNRVDVLVTDIRMPKIDGITLGRMAKDLWSFTEVIFVSGHRDFSYASDAIDVGAVAYVTKPVEHDKLLSAVQEAVARIERRHRDESLVARATSTLDESTQVLKTRFYRTWVASGHGIGPDEVVRTIERLRLPIAGAKRVCLALLQVEDARSDRSDRAIRHRQQSLQELVRRLVLGERRGDVFDVDERRIGIILGVEEERDCNELYRFLDGIAPTLQSCARQMVNASVALYWYRCVDSILSIPDVYRHIQERITHSMAFVGGSLSGNVDSFEAHRRTLESLRAYPAFSELLELQDPDAVEERLNLVFGEVRSLLPLSIENTLEVYMMVSHAVLNDALRRGVRLGEWLGSDLPGLLSFDHVRSIDRLEEWCRSVAKKYLRYVCSTASTGVHTTVRRIKQHIVENLSNELDMASIADLVQLNPNYVSRLFRKTTGMTITDFVIGERIQKAKELLQLPGVKIYEVAEAVGYFSETHFVRVFKRMTGKTPKQYQTTMDM